MESQILPPSTWTSSSNFTCSTLHQATPYNPELDFYGVDASCFSFSYSSPENSSIISSNSYVHPIFPDEYFTLINSDDGIHIRSSMEGLGEISNGDIEDICEWLNINNSEGDLSSPIPMEKDEWSPCLSTESSQNSGVFLSTEMSIVLPGDEMEIDDELSLLHLIRAYGEAVENGEKELADVIVKAINKKSSPLGKTMERVTYNLFQSRESEGEYLRQESCKNVVAAFKVFYQSLPYGRFAHFTSNSIILESMPSDAAVIHIVDFDIGEGMQWPPIIEALSRTHMQVRLTSIKSEEESNSSCWTFDETKKRLLIHARQYGLKLYIEEKKIEDLANELIISRTKKGQSKEWLVFNCMVGLPHMGRRQPRNRVTQFLKTAKELLAHLAGIAILGDGETWESTYTGSSYTSFFNGLLRHYQALFESLERNFPTYLAEARTAMESLFLAPFMCPVSWAQDWENREKSFDLGGLKGQKVSQTCLTEARQMVNERENSYSIKIEGQTEIVLLWKETPLVRVSSWI